MREACRHTRRARVGGGGGAPPLPARRGGRGCARAPGAGADGGAVCTAIRDHTWSRPMLPTSPHIGNIT